MADDPRMPAIGSTIPDNCLYQRLCNRDIPSHRSGIETASPSGKFWIPIPRARAIAAPNEAAGKPAAIVPKATPTARPSGMLCNVMARISKVLCRQLVFIPSASSSGNPTWRCGNSLSIARKKMSPKRKPVAAGIHAGISLPAESSITGARSDQ